MTTDGEQNITVWLARWKDGDQDALGQLLPWVYQELRQMAASELRAHAGHATLQPTALVHDVLLKLIGAEHIDIQNRKHFFTTVAKLMRQVLIDRARAAMREKRGGGQWQRVELTQAMDLPISEADQLPALDEALNALAVLDPRMAQIVELRCFGGVEVAQVAQLLEVDERTIYRDWAMAKAWLRERLS